MRTRLVRVRRRTKTTPWVLMFLMIAMAMYIRVSLLDYAKMQAKEASAGAGERVTREIELKEAEIHLVSFGGYDTQERARIEAARYVPRGAAGYILDDERLEVIGAGYASREDAERVCAQLAAEEGITCRVISLESPEVTLRMTAGKEQIGAFVRGEAVLRETAAALGQLAFSVDRGEAGSEQAAAVVGTHLEKVAEAIEALKDAEGTGSELFDWLGGQLESLKEQLTQIRKETRTMMISSRLKHCHTAFEVSRIGRMKQLAE